MHTRSSLSFELLSIVSAIDNHADRSASPVALFIDLHGHSVKTDHFLFGYEGGRAGKVGTRVLPWIMQETDDGFSWKKSKFNKGKNKETTGRFVVCTYAHPLSAVRLRPTQAPLFLMLAMLRPHSLISLIRHSYRSEERC